jgi:DNA-binding NtrC family response regulator
MNILIIDDDENTRKVLEKVLIKMGCPVDCAANGEDGLLLARHKEYSIAVVDLVLPGIGGQEILEKFKQEFDSVEVIVISGYGSVDTAVKALKSGAYDFITKPINIEHFSIVVRKCLEKQGLKQETSRLTTVTENLRKEAQDKFSFGEIIGKNHQMQEIYKVVESLSTIDSTVLVMGETGTGKGLLAHTIHYNSVRKENPFITVDCGSVPETLLESELFGHEKGAFTGAFKRRIGKFEQADKGTIFLDEIGDISPNMQQRLLRVLQERRIERVGGEKSINVDVRVVAATNKDLRKLVDEGKFREDLFYRLNIIPIHIPPLRNRLDDLPHLVSYFLKKYRDKLKKDVRTISQEAINAMLSYHWPGNIREVENLIERAIIMTPGKEVKKVDIPGERRNKGIYSFGKIDVTFPLKKVKEQVIDQLEKKYLTQLLREKQGNINAVARSAQVDNKTLYEKMKRHGLRKEEFKNQEGNSNNG